MAKKNKLFKFSMTPASWGLSGKVYEEAEAYYNYDGEDLDRKLAEIKHRDSPNDLKIENLKIDFKYGKMPEYDFDKAMVEAKDLSETEKKMELVKVEHRHGKISDIKFEKEIFTLEKKPWVGVIDQSIDTEQGVSGFYIELDWNEYWIDFLRKNGYSGVSDEVMVEQWFSDVNNSMQSEEIASIMPLARQMRTRK